MILLPELTDEILTHLQDDERTLQNCSLVAKSWVHSSQKPLYSHVHLTPVTHRTWRKKVSPTSGVMQHVRTLSCRGLDSLHSFHGDFFKSLHLLERLDFHGSMRIEPNVTNLFTTFQTTLSSLSLSGVSATWGALVNVVDYFPNLRDLHLGQSSFVGGCWGVPPLSRPTRGKLCLFTLSSVDMSILSAGLSASKLQYNELEIIDVVGPTPSRAIIPIISACRKTLTRLVLGSYDSSHDPTLKKCSELRELVFITSWQVSKEPALISSITSMNIQKIVFVLSDSEWSYARWSSLDVALLNLVDRLRASRYKHTLELEFQLKPESAVIDPTDDPEVIFPSFREEGRVTILQKTSGRIIYRSDG